MDDNAASKPLEEEEEEGFGEDGSMSESETDSDELRPVMNVDDALALAQALQVNEPESLIENEELMRQRQREDTAVFTGDDDNCSPDEGDVSGEELEVRFNGDDIELEDVNEQSLAEFSSIKSKKDDVELKDVNEESLAEFSSVKSKRDDVELKDVNEPSLAELASVKSKRDDVEFKDINEPSLAEFSPVKSTRDDVELKDVYEPSLAELASEKSKGDDVELKDINEPSLAELASVKSTRDDVELKDVKEPSLAELASVKSKGDDVEMKDINEPSLAEFSPVKSTRDDVELKDVNEPSLAELASVKSKGDDVELKDVNEPSFAELDSVKSKGGDVQPKNVNEQSLAEPEHVSPTSTQLKSCVNAQDDGSIGKNRGELNDSSPECQDRKEVLIPMLGGGGTGKGSPQLCFDNKGSGTVEEQKAFAKEVEAFYKGKHVDYKHPKFYKEDLNLLKLWRAVIDLGGYEQVTTCKLWRQVGESFNPPKTCTTVSWTFRNIYEKALLDYEKHKMHGGELKCPVASFPESNGTANQAANISQAIGSGSGRARRDAAARAMQGWHSQGLLGNGEEDKIPTPAFKGFPKRKRPSSLEHVAQPSHIKSAKPHLDSMVIDSGPPAEWIKMNVHKLNDCFEVYGLIPGFMRDEVHVQSDPIGRLVITGQPKELNNPWGVTPFKKVVTFPSRIDPQQISAVVTLHGQLFVRVPFEQL